MREFIKKINEIELISSKDKDYFKVQAYLNEIKSMHKKISFEAI
jgi:hypothetical protein